MNEEMFVEAFQNVVWYNGYYECMRLWIDCLQTQERPCLMDIPNHLDDESYWQLQVLNIMLVTMFGDYGTSPRFGWIEKQKECIDFLNKVIEGISEC